MEESTDRSNRRVVAVVGGGLVRKKKKKELMINIWLCTTLFQMSWLSNQMHSAPTSECVLQSDCLCNLQSRMLHEGKCDFHFERQ